MAFKGREEYFTERRVCARIVSKEEREGGDLCRTVGNRVVLKLGRGEELRPLVRVVCAKDPEISFNFLISSFGLPISLGVISGGETDIIFENPSELSGGG